MTVRDFQQLGSLAANNFFLFTFLILTQSSAFLFIDVFLGLLLLFPLSSDPLRKLPADRLQSWPLSRRDSILLRLLSVWFSPAAWITVALLVWVSRPIFGLVFMGAALVFYGLTALLTALPARAPRMNLLRYVPEFPGALGGLVRKNIRELLMLLDPYAALVLTISGTAYRIFGDHVDPDALLILSLLIVLALSTHALTLFGLDTSSGFTRYRLLPVRGWQVLATKDAAFLLVLSLLVLPLAPLAGFAAGLMALTVGHHASIKNPSQQVRWRFTGGASLTAGLLQAFLMFSAGTMVFRTSKLVLLPCALLYLGSLWYFGRALEQSGD